MTDQSNSAAERSAHVHRGDAPSPADWPVVQIFDGTWKLKSIVALENRIETLEAALRFYADPSKYTDIHGDDVQVPDFYSETDFGETARVALAGSTK